MFMSSIKIASGAARSYPRQEEVIVELGGEPNGEVLRPPRPPAVEIGAHFVSQSDASVLASTSSGCNIVPDTCVGTTMLADDSANHLGPNVANLTTCGFSQQPANKSNRRTRTPEGQAVPVPVEGRHNKPTWRWRGDVPWDPSPLTRRMLGLPHQGPIISYDPALESHMFPVRADAVTPGSGRQGVAPVRKDLFDARRARRPFTVDGEDDDVFKSPKSKPYGAGRGPASKVLTDCTRWCVFNTGTLSQAGMWVILAKVTEERIFDNIRKVEAVLQPNGACRMDFWISKGLSKAVEKLFGSRAQKGKTVLRRALCEAYGGKDKVPRWRVKLYSSLDERGGVTLSRRNIEPTVSVAGRRGICTVNVNSWPARVDEFALYLARRGIGIAVVQETLVTRWHDSIRVPGYSVFSRPRVAGFPGMALLVSQEFMTYEVVDDGAPNHVIHVSVSKMTEGRPWHIIGVYLPSGSNREGERRKCLSNVLATFRGIIRKEPDAKVVILGDFNYTRECMKKRLSAKRWLTSLGFARMEGSLNTRTSKSGRWSSIDHILVSPAAQGWLGMARVDHKWGAMSDHVPVWASVKGESDNDGFEPVKVHRWNREKLPKVQHTFVHHNRWEEFMVAHAAPQSEEELNASADGFVRTMNDVADELRVRSLPVEGGFRVPRSIARAVDRRNRLGAKLQQAKRDGVSDTNELAQQFEAAKQICTKALRALKKDRAKKEVERAAELLAQRMPKQWHTWEASQKHTEAVASKVTPVMQNGELKTSLRDILAATKEHFAEVNTDNTEGKISRDPGHWEGIPLPQKPTMDELNRPLSWVEDVMWALEGMASGTAAGPDAVPSDIYKALRREEYAIRAKIIQDGKADMTFGGGERVDPTDCPHTPMGKALFDQIKAVWERKKVPTKDHFSHQAPLFKNKGSPTDLNNYRGINLINDSSKIVTRIVAHRLLRALEDRQALCKEQAGFRSHEEAVAQFVTFYEVVRRRKIKGRSTYAVFVDFQKAFDRVHHAAMFYKLRKIGVDGPILDLIMDIYKTSKCRIRLDGHLSEAFDIERGTRQGCPLSPILFNIFINDLVDDLRHEGVGVPIGEGGRDELRIKSLLFADDLLGLCDSDEEVKVFLNSLSEWAQKWDLPIGSSKCGVMWLGNHKTVPKDDPRRKVVYNTPFGDIEHVESYKYLGFQVSLDLGDYEFADKEAHAKELADRVRKRVFGWISYLRKPQIPLFMKLITIRTRIIPCGTYGGEWIGFHKGRADMIQKWVDLAVRVAVGGVFSSSRHYKSVALFWETKLPSIYEQLTVSRIRLFEKAPDMNTWLADLVSNPFTKGESPKKTWVSSTKDEITKFQKRAQNIVHKPMFVEAREAEKAKRKRQLMLEEQGKDVGKKHLNIRHHISSLAYMSNDTATKPYQEIDLSDDRRLYYRGHMAMTRDYIGEGLRWTELAVGFNWLMRLRLDAFWSTEAWARFAGEREGSLPCPCCGESLRDAPADGWEEHYHILARCEAHSAARKTSGLDNIISQMKEGLQAAGVIGEHQVDVPWITDQVDRYEAARAIITVALLGGVWRPPGSDTGMALRPKLTQRMEGEEAWWATFNLSGWCDGWGWRSGSFNPWSDDPGCVIVARYLQSVMPQHVASLLRGEPEEGHPMVETKTPPRRELRRREFRLMTKAPQQQVESHADMALMGSPASPTPAGHRVQGPRMLQGVPNANAIQHGSPRLNREGAE